MSTLGEIELGAILGILATGPQIYGKTFAYISWDNQKHSPCCLGLELIKFLILRIRFLSSVSVPELCVSKDCTV